MTKKLICDVIIKMEAEGFRIQVIIFDLGNKTLMKELGFTKGKYFFQHPVDPDRIVYMMPDVPHVVKLVRNHLVDHGFLVPTEDKTHLVHLDVEDFRKILEKDNSEFRVTKLSELHLNARNSERQRVRLAKQLLSGSCAKAILFNDDSVEAKAKANAIQLFNDFSDVMDSGSKYHPNKLRCGLGIHKLEQFEVLHKMEEFMELMEIDRGEGHLTEVDGVVLDLHDPNIDHLQILADKRAADPNFNPDIHISEYVYKPPVVKEIKVKKPIKIQPNRKKPALIPWQHGVKCVIKSTRGLFMDLVEYGPLEFLMMKRTDQDFLENMYSQNRALGADNDHPGPLTYLIRNRILMIGKHADILVNNPAVEIEPKDKAIALEEEEIVTKFVTKDIPVAHVYELDENDTIPDAEHGSIVLTGEIPDVRAHAENYEQFNLGAQAEAYVAGYIAKKFKDKFDLGVKTSEVSELAQESLDKFPWLKMISKGGLYMPHQEWLDDFRRFEVEFNAFHGVNLDRGEKIFDRFAEVLEKKFKDKYGKELYKFYAKFRVCMRVKSLNRQTLHSGSNVTVIRDAKQRGQFMA